MLATMGRTCQRSALRAVHEWRCLSDMEGEKRRKREGGGKVGRPNCRLYSDTGGEECVWQAHLWSFERREACWQTPRGLPGQPYKDMIGSACGWPDWVKSFPARLQIRGYVRECVEIHTSANCCPLSVRKRRKLTERKMKRLAVPASRSQATWQEFIL